MSESLSDYRKRCRYLIKLSRHPSVKSLASIIADCNRLQDRIAEFRRDHPPGHWCACCNYIRDKMGGTPSVHDNLNAIETILWSCGELSDEERPIADTEDDRKWWQ